MKVLNKHNLSQVLQTLSAQAEVLVPATQNGKSGFHVYSDLQFGQEMMFDALNVFLPPKGVVLPQTERMYDLKHRGINAEITKTYEDRQPRIVFGIRSCDLKAMLCMDEVFLSGGFVDSFYQTRRGNTVLIAHGCYEPGPNCFCGAMGIQPDAGEGADVVLNDTVDGNYVWTAQTEKGNDLTALISGFLEEREADLAPVKPFSLNLRYEGVAEQLKDKFDDPIWEDIASPCMTCGICTMVCPSCYCFDIQVKSRGDEGYRFRCYDSCMYSEYTLMAGGHNPRPTANERLRNRFLHKLQYFNERYGHPLCTGCGRCTVACPQGISIVQIVEAMGKEAGHHE